MVIIADPQLTDSYSYKQQKGLLLSATEFFCDKYMQRSYHSITQHLPSEYDLLFLGDLFDGGREFDSDDEFSLELARFKRIFQLNNVMMDISNTDRQVFFTSGNHDVGFGRGMKEHIYRRFVSNFGDASYLVENWGGGVELVVLDLMLLYSSLSVFEDEVLALVEKLATRNHDKQRILFTHVPLYRSANAGCGNLGRNNPVPILQGSGYQYQNLIDPQLSAEILQVIRPDVVFGGDDHDQCLVYHNISGYDHSIPEYTVGTFSWMQGNKWPSFGMLTTYQGNWNYQICLLPSQFYIYMSYIFAFLITLGVIAWRATARMFALSQQIPMYYSRLDKNERGNKWLKLSQRILVPMSRIAFYGIGVYLVLLWAF